MMMSDEDNQLLVTSAWSRRRKFASIGVLFLINLLNYMDRFTIAGVLTQIQKYFDIDDSSAGLLQTIFVVFYMMFAPVCGYYGDRYNRKIIIQIGLIVWMTAVILSTFCRPVHFYLFMLCRGIVGIGEASYVTVAPTIIADMYTGNRRSCALMVFYFAIPVGSGLGYATGAAFSLWTNTWLWGVRVTPIFGIVCFLLLFFIVEEPVRGEAEHSNLLPSSFVEDIKYLFTVPTYIITTLGLTLVVFVVGCLGWWTPTLMQYAWAVHHGTSYIDTEVKAEMGLVFGIVTCLAGFFGVFFGSFLSQIWRSGFGSIPKNAYADLHVCALGSLSAVPFLYYGLILSSKNMILCMVFTFFAVTGCCVNWAVNMDILMSVISLRRRSIATAIQTLISHLFGDAFSPYLIGLISDAVRGHERSTLAHFIALQRSLFVPNFVLCFGSLMFLVATFYIDQDRRNAIELAHDEQLTAENGSDTSPLLDAVEREPTT
ncbi:major facilitator superfamily transporter [Loa loa]|uniref:Major facilitator superfamily transporter n=1 Tax=Loa loa TaxID=7209 RepID=A0A1I7VG13_LOALO|nr:major facilitator superfamily transporter [Loa loa]EFO18422.1 major facilitator superfamily transporter [Loa loa]